MNKTFSFIFSIAIALLIAPAAFAQFTADGTSKGSLVGGSSSVEIKNLSAGKAELVFTGVTSRVDKAHLCLTGVGKNWAGNSAGTQFDMKRMACAVPKDGQAVIPINVGEARGIPLALLPLSVMENGTLLKWEQQPAGPTLHSFTSRTTGQKSQITLLWVNQDGSFQPASAEQAKDFSD